MPTAASREVYFETGLDVLSELGYGGLKLAEVCKRLGVTTGSFYHHFASWSVYTSELIRYWVDAQTVRQVDLVRAEPDPHRRIDQIIQIGLALPHGAEAAIRAWSSADPEVHGVQAQVDQERFDILRESALEVLHDRRQAQLFASWGMYLLVGYEQALLPRDATAFAWIVGQLTYALHSGRFTDVPPD
ncbi:MAG TPA: TetR/AcrR family transcriptional regulator [Mycobacterium sp.]